MSATTCSSSSSESGRKGGLAANATSKPGNVASAHPRRRTRTSGVPPKKPTGIPFGAALQRIAGVSSLPATRLATGAPNSLRAQTSGMPSAVIKSARRMAAR
jgi:hypothetical protein